MENQTLAGISRKAEEKSTLARKLKSLGLSFDMIIQSTGLTVEEIDKL